MGNVAPCRQMVIVHTGDPSEATETQAEALRPTLATFKRALKQTFGLRLKLTPLVSGDSLTCRLIIHPCGLGFMRRCVRPRLCERLHHFSIKVNVQLE